jgi:hypothetical protein
MAQHSSIGVSVHGPSDGFGWLVPALAVAMVWAYQSAGLELTKNES